MKKNIIIFVALIGFGFVANAKYKHFYTNDGAKLSLNSTGEVLYYPPGSNKAFEGGWDNETNSNNKITIWLYVEGGRLQKWTAYFSGFDVVNWERTTSGKATLRVEGGPGGTFTLNDR